MCVCVCVCVCVCLWRHTACVPLPVGERDQTGTVDSWLVPTDAEASNSQESHPGNASRRLRLRKHFIGVPWRMSSFRNRGFFHDYLGLMRSIVSRVQGGE